MLGGAYLTLYCGIQVRLSKHRCNRNHGSLDTGTFDPFQPWFWLQVMLELRKLDGTAKEVT